MIHDQATVDPRAIIDPSAEVGEGVSIGPYSVIGPGVRIGRNTWVGPHVVINGPTLIGEDNKIFQFASVGEVPQDKKYAGEETMLEIGDRNVIREFATINRGTVQDAGRTRVGNDNLLMAYTHVAHDCVIDNHVIMANAASLGGHVHINDWAILGGFTIVHQFCQIGAHSFCGMGTGVTKDIPPYLTVSGHPAEPRGINSEGLRRRGFEEEAIQAIKRAYKALYMRNLKLEQAVDEIARLAETEPCVAVMLEFLQRSQRSIVR